MLRKNRTFAKMFTSYGISAFGDYFDFMAVFMLLGYVWRADAMTMALVPLAYAIPSIVLSQVAGIIADRWNRRNLMIITDLVRGVLTLMMALAPDAGLLLGLIALRSIARVFHFPAQQAMTRQVVTAEQMLQAVSLNGMVFQFSKLLGPLLGSAVASASSPAICILINGISFFVSAIILLAVPAEQGFASTLITPEAEMTKARTAWQEGWQVLTRTRILWISILFSLIGFAGIQLIDAQIATLLRDIIPEQPMLMGWLITAIGAGGLASAIWLRRCQQLRAFGWLLGGGLFLIGLMFAVAGIFEATTPRGVLIGAAVLGGIGTGFTSIGMNYILQKETPPAFMGRLSGIYDSLTSVILVIAPLSGGLLIRWWGAPITFLVVGIAVGCVGLLGIMLRSLWHVSTDGQIRSM